MHWVFCGTSDLQDMTRPPRTLAGQFSAQKIGTVEALQPMPMPRSNRVTRSCCQFCVTAEPITENKQNMPLSEPNQVLFRIRS